MTRKEIGICLVGTGRAGLIHGRNFAGAVPNARVVAVSDPVAKSSGKACAELGVDTAYADYKEAMKNEEIDAIVIATPTDLHKDIVVAAATAGKHIFCEKPMAITVEECDEMIEITEKHGVKLQIGFMRRFDRSFVAAKERIEQGEIGEVVLVKSLTHGPSVPRPWQYDIKKSNGPLAEVSSHDVDSLRWFTGSEFDEVYAVAGNFRCPDAKKDFPEFYDNVIMTARFANGMQGLVEGAVSVLYGYDARVEILGTRGVMTVGRLEENSVVASNVDNKMVKTVVKSWRSLFEEAYILEDRNFIECILEDKPPRVTGLDGKMAVKVVNAGNLSIAEKRPVKLWEL